MRILALLCCVPTLVQTTAADPALTFIQDAKATLETRIQA